MKNAVRLSMVMAWLATTASCSNLLAPQPDPSRFYLLSRASGPTAAAAHGASLAIGLGPILFPAYLKRPEVVTRVDHNRMELSKVDRWAAPLDTTFARVLSDDLASELSINQVIAYPWWNTVKIDYQVQIEVDRFNSVSGKNVEMSARWSISDGKSGKVLYSATSDLSEPFAQGNTEASVEALSKTVAAFASQIAQAIRALQERLS
jgi:uncharacterized lipoprotein YmbA